MSFFINSMIPESSKLEILIEVHSMDLDYLETE